MVERQGVPGPIQTFTLGAAVDRCQPYWDIRASRSMTQCAVTKGVQLPDADAAFLPHHVSKADTLKTAVNLFDK